MKLLIMFIKWRQTGKMEQMENETNSYFSAIEQPEQVKETMETRNDAFQMTF